MTLPRFVYVQRSKGRTYYYFNAAQSAYDRNYVRLPDIADPEFEPAYQELLASRPVPQSPEGTPYPRRPAKPSMVYFIGGDVGAIKIGTSADPTARLAKLQTGSPIELRILAMTQGGGAKEREYHDRFKRTRLNGEWFKRTPALLAEIERLNAWEKWLEQKEPVQNGFQNGFPAEKIC